MKFLKNSSRLMKTASLLLLLSLCSGIMVGDLAKAESNKGSSSRAANRRQAKGDKMSSDLRARASHWKADQDTVKVIVQFNGQPSPQVNSILKRSGVRVKGVFHNFDSRAVELPASVVAELANYPETLYISLDSEIRTMGHVSATTGTDAIRHQIKTSLLGGTTNYTLDGKGIGIAVVDSGIDTSHKSFLGNGNNLRVVVSRDFTGENRTDDPYGHGTHVASTAAGNGRISNGSYIGIAPEANIVNLRVLNKKGSGSVSGLLEALDWLMNNRNAFNVRVVNMSLGTPAVESYKNDPVCQAVRRLVNAGVVVVAAAGNNGKNGMGAKVYGQIHAPGNEPSALTVGASNSYGTDARGDDSITTYSSRGPTRSYWTDTSGIKHYDNLIKPDIVAPGNKLIYAQAVDNLLVTEHPEMDAGVSPVDNRKMMYLNGTSMATPVAAGAAALLLQANPKLTPNMVKMILMYTAQQLNGYNMLEQGAGQVNIEGAVRLAKLIRTDLLATTILGAPLLTTLTPPTPQTTISGHTFKWSQGIILNQTYARGANLITKYQKIYGTGILLGDGVMLGDGVLIGDGVMLGDGVLIGDNIMTSNGVLIGDGAFFCSIGVLLGDGVLIGDGVMLGDGVLIGDGVMLGDGVLIGDAYLQAQSAMSSGDMTLSMELEVDSGVDYIGY